MKKYIAALYANGRVVTGCNHGDAFSKLSVMEQDGDLESGFYDPETGKFFTEEYEFYMKQILLIRHGEATGCCFDDDLTEIGVLQARKAAEFLCQNYDLAEFEAISSPYLRCRRTADIIARITGLTFSTDQRVRERGDDEGSDTFLARIHEALAHSSSKTIYISHSDFIVNFAEQAVRHRITDCERMPGGSVTFIDAKRLVCCGRECYCEEESKSISL